jgi:hypothetical protein
VRAQLGLVVEELRLVEGADEVAQREHGVEQLAFVGADMEVALRLGMLAERGRGPQVEHEVEALRGLQRRALEVDRAGGFAHAHALAVRLAAAHVDLVAEVDGAFGAGVDAGIAARAQVEVDRVVRRPRGFERTEPAGERRELPGMHRQVAALRQRATGGDEQARLQACTEHRRRALDGVGRADDEAAPAAGVADGRHRLGIRALRRGNQRRDLRRRLRRVLRPAGRLANVDEADRPLGHARRTDGLLVQLEEEPRLLRARDQ